MEPEERKRWKAAVNELRADWNPERTRREREAAERRIFWRGAVRGGQVTVLVLAAVALLIRYILS